LNTCVTLATRAYFLAAEFDARDGQESARHAKMIERFFREFSHFNDAF
jgi:hypothetical protein